MFWKSGRCCDLAKGNSAFVFEEIIVCLLQIFFSPDTNLFKKTPTKQFARPNGWF